MDTALTTRAPRPDEAQAVTDLVIACDIHELGEPDFELDDLLTDWHMPGFDLERDAVVVVDGDRIDLLVPSMHADHLRERIRTDCAELLR